jgi:hypothetical protein
VKIIILYLSGLSLAWLGLNSFLFGLAFWSRDGALMPTAAGLALILLAARLLLALVRLYLPPKDPQGRLLD